MRRRKKRGALESLLAYENMVISTRFGIEKAREKLEEIINKDELELEIGSGRTSFLIEHAVQNIDKFFIAIEFKEELLLYAAKDSSSKKLDNIVFLLALANELPALLGRESLSKIYLNFSDPWPKRRHAKRRLSHLDYLNIYHDLLKEKGEIELKTDHHELFEFTKKELSKSKFKILDISYDIHAEKENIIMSDYEGKFVETGKKIKFLKAVKVNEK